jgi:glycosyltransferase involved in cell wall biosynthesis
MSKNKIKIAFVKFGGLAGGGTERFIQNIAAALPRSRYEVDFYYCDAAPYVGSDWRHPDTDPSRKKFLEDAKVNLIKFNVAAKDVTRPHHPWLETDFFDIFDETKYDIIQTGRAGHAEYPFTEIHDATIVDAICLPGMAEKKSNVAKVMHISKWQADTWVNAGGEAHKVEVVPILTTMEPITKVNLRETLGIKEDDFVYGFHQRADDGIFAPHSLAAYKSVQSENTHFILLGGSDKYVDFAQENNLQNFHRLPHTSGEGGDKKRDEFLATLDVFAHARADGETYGACIAEALYYGLPALSHVAPAVGHIETIGDAGVVCGNLQQYVDEMMKLKLDKDYYKMRSENAVKHYEKNLSSKVIIEKVMGIYEKVLVQKIADNKANNASDEDFWNDMWEEEK